MKKLNYISAMLSAAASAAGIFTSLYSDIPWAVAQMKGQDAVTIISAVVLVFFSTSKLSRSKIITAGINAYLIYTYFFYTLEVKLNPLFHIYLAIVLLSLVSLILTIAKLKNLHSAELKTRSRVFSIIYLCAIGSTLAFLWNADIIASLSGSPLLETATGEPLTIVYVFDLTFVIPAIIYSVYLLKKKKSFGISLCGIMLVKCVTMGAALLGMTIGVCVLGFELETFLAVFWFILTAGGILALILFMRDSSIDE